MLVKIKRLLQKGPLYRLYLLKKQCWIPASKRKMNQLKSKRLMSRSKLSSLKKMKSEEKRTRKMRRQKTRRMLSLKPLRKPVQMKTARMSFRMRKKTVRNMIRQPILLQRPKWQRKRSRLKPQQKKRL